METLIKRSMIFSLILITSFFLACSKPNPLLNEEYVQRLKTIIHTFQNDTDNYWVNSLGNNNAKMAKECPGYFSGSSKGYNSEALCNEWREKVYKVLMNNKKLPHDATLQQFKDPALWAAIEGQ